MKYLIFMLFLSLPKYGIAQETPSKLSETSNSFIGNWNIDLRPTPDSDEYFQYFVVKTINKNAFNGTFYSSEITNGILNNNWPELYFAFSTTDQSNEYYHSGYLKDGKLYGITYCPKRGFTAPWTGIKE
ncbi:hypothetical protein [Algibacter luteus]|uniref:hypothetical protein n=1 Tax=Algibacter luteus TaxID=1178825 RepID=UPI002599CF10|nr:hypothetical protein [Algibacter luteus]WJJ96147.1 hypothetical protein O5O44_13060 [Algibacter luteus]